MSTERIIIDCDPGVDDAIALLLAFSSPRELEVLGITTVAGNVSLEKTTSNALRICELAGRSDIPVFAGSRHAMFPTPARNASAHGTDGLGDIGLNAPRMARRSGHAVDFIIDTILNAPGEVTLCPIGPMTNIALALLKEPDIAGKIKRIVFMGGAAFCPGNTSPAAEFNIWFDPHAAQIVLTSGVPQVMLGLDVTNKAIMTDDQIKALHGSGTILGARAAEMLTSYGNADPCLHDPCVVAYLLQPSLFAGVNARVDVDCASILNRGRTVAAVSDRHRAGSSPNCHIITDVENEGLFRLLMDRLSDYCETVV